MTIDNWLTFAGTVLTFVGLVFVALQMRDAIRQRKVETQIRLYDINRELISMGFEKKELFEVLNDAENIDPTIERRYLQLWLNQLALINSFKRSGGFEKEVQECFEADLRGMVTMNNMRRHWDEFKKFYPASFQKSVDDILDEAGCKLSDARGAGATN